MENLRSISLQVKHQHVSKGKQREAETRHTADWQGLPTLRRVCGTGGAGQSCTVQCAHELFQEQSFWRADKISFLLTKSALAGHVQLKRCFWTIYSKHQKRQILDIETTGFGTLHPALHGEVGRKDAEQRCESAEEGHLIVCLHGNVVIHWCWCCHSLLRLQFANHLISDSSSRLVDFVRPWFVFQGCCWFYTMKMIQSIQRVVKDLWGNYLHCSHCWAGNASVMVSLPTAM